MDDERTSGRPVLQLVDTPSDRDVDAWSGRGEAPEAAQAPAVLLWLTAGSDAWYLLEHAVDWAERLGASLHVCAAVEPVRSNPWDVLEASTHAQRTELMRRDMEVWLQRLAACVPASALGSCEIVEGEPGPILAERARGMRLVIVGRSMPRGHGVSILSCGQPVLVAHGRRPRARPRVHLPLDHRLSRFDAAGWLGRNLRDADVSVLYPIAGASPPPRVTTPPREALGLGECLLESGVVRVPGGASIAEVVVSEAERADADLVVIPAAPRRGLARLFGTVSESITRAAHCSVLLVPVAPACEPEEWRMFG
ncbi:MAG: nucleotide-binding universal stress UspA family protein [Myxococcota bacterium]|jgi:nucleotide-binding universal stress UspA family protein